MRASGLAPREILTAATVGGARLMGRDDLGRLDEGMQADLVVLDRNPLDDVANAASVHRIVKEGRVYDPDTLLPPTPEEVVRQGANAFNARDLGGFLDSFAPDLEIYEHPSTLRSEGRDALREQMAPIFETATNLHVRLHNLTTVGNTVMVHETIEGLPDRDAPLTQGVLYRVTDGQIDRTWLIQE